MRKGQILSCVFVSVAAGSQQVMGAASFSDTLKEYDPHYSQEAVSGGNANQPSFATDNGFEFSYIWNGNSDINGAYETVKFSNAGATFGDNHDSDAGRNSLRTIESGYGTTSFTAGVTINNPSTDRQVWIGLGSGTRSGNDYPDYGLPDAYYNTTDSKDNVLTVLSLNSANEIKLDANVLNGGDNRSSYTNNGYGLFDDPNGVNAGPIRLQMKYDASAHTVQFAFDTNYNGTFVADYSGAVLSTADVFTDPTDIGKVYVGGDDKVTLSDLTVSVPEPSSLGLLAVSMAALLPRRKKVVR